METFGYFVLIFGGPIFFAYLVKHNLYSDNSGRIKIVIGWLVLSLIPTVGVPSDMGFLAELFEYLGVTAGWGIVAGSVGMLVSASGSRNGAKDEAGERRARRSGGVIEGFKEGAKKGPSVEKERLYVKSCNCGYQSESKTRPKNKCPNCGKRCIPQMKRVKK